MSNSVCDASNQEDSCSWLPNPNPNPVHVVCVCQEMGVYFPVDVGHVEVYGSLSVRLMSVDLVSHSDIVIRDFLLSLNKKQVSNCNSRSLYTTCIRVQGATKTRQLDTVST